MKKIILSFICLISLSLFSQATESNSFSNSAPACVESGNVDASINAKEGRICLKNNNNYMVTVTWKAYGHTKDNKKIVIGGATYTLTSHEYIDPKAVSTSDRYVSYSIDLKVEKCN